jgi:hypothetical protein
MARQVPMRVRGHAWEHPETEPAIGRHSAAAPVDPSGQGFRVPPHLQEASNDAMLALMLFKTSAALRAGEEQR